MTTSTEHTPGRRAVNTSADIAIQRSVFEYRAVVDAERRMDEIDAESRARAALAAVRGEG